MNNVATKGIGRGNTDEGEISTIDNIGTEEFVNILNSYRKDGEETYPAEWKKWKLGEEGYPVFIQGNENE